MLYSLPWSCHLLLSLPILRQSNTNSKSKLLVEEVWNLHPTQQFSSALCNVRNLHLENVYLLRKMWRFWLWRIFSLKLCSLSELDAYPFTDDGRTLELFIFSVNVNGGNLFNLFEISLTKAKCAMKWCRRKPGGKKKEKLSWTTR